VQSSIAALNLSVSPRSVAPSSDGVASTGLTLAQSASGNWFADVIFHAYDDASRLKDEGGADAVFICAGTIRGDSVYCPGENSAAVHWLHSLFTERLPYRRKCDGDTPVPGSYRCPPNGWPNDLGSSRKLSICVASARRVRKSMDPDLYSSKPDAFLSYRDSKSDGTPRGPKGNACSV